MFTLVGGIYQLHLEASVVPCLFDWAGRKFCVDVIYFTSPSKMLIGMEMYPRTMRTAITELRASNATGASDVSPVDWKHAPQTMAQVKTQQADREDVPGRNPPDLKTGHHVVINIAFNERCFGMKNSGGELQQVKNNENKK